MPELPEASLLLPLAKSQFADHFAANQMLLDDALQVLWRSAVIPDTIRPHHRNGALLANAKTVGSRAEHAGGRCITFGRLVEPQFLQTVLQKLPTGGAIFLTATLGLGLIGTKKDMP